MKYLLARSKRQRFWVLGSSVVLGVLVLYGMLRSQEHVFLAVSVAFSLLCGLMVFGFCYSWPFVFGAFFNQSRHPSTNAFVPGLGALLWMAVVVFVLSSIDFVLRDKNFDMAMSILASLGLYNGCVHYHLWCLSGRRGGG